jgi:SAM-dependent methyltransferase
MGVDVHNLQLMALAQDLGARFDRTLAIGRQAVFVDAPQLQTVQALRGLPALNLPPTEPGRPPYFEPLMAQWFGAAQADSVDASAYEGATFVHDMNLPWPADGAQRGQYDAVLDFGCLEHVFDFPTAWRNCVDLCAVGGHVLHALPANNLSGHGFYQFSPELFFNLYQPERGFELRGLFFAQKDDAAHWWRVASPMVAKRRINLCNSHEVYMLVLARKLREVGPLPAPQQSDYAQDEWLQAGGNPVNMARSRWQAPLAALGLLDTARRWRATAQALRRSGLALPAPDYQRVRLAELLKR